MAKQIVIVGNGVAGITAAFTARERDSRCRITVVGGESDFFISRTALMYAFMDKLDRRDLEPHERKVYDKRAIELVRDVVVDLRASDGKAGGGVLVLRSGKELPYDRLLLATGSVPRRLDVPGIAGARGVVGFVSLDDLDRCEEYTPTTRRAVVVGGGLIGIELVECLRHHGVAVTFLLRDPWYWPIALAREEGDMATAHMRAHGVDVRHEEQIAAVERDSDGRVSAIVTHKGERIECQLLGVCIGVEPCMAWLSSVKTPPAMGRGICVDSQLRTSLPDVWAAGDCAEIRFEGADARPPLVEQIWYSAKRQGELVGKNLTGASLRYQPPLFFNSAKLFDIEYTTVGDVSRPPPGTRTLYRRDGKRPLSQRILFLDDRVIGFNLLGSRWDHTVLARWIDEHRDIEWVQDHLGDAQFDVELGRADLGRMTERELAIVGDSAPGERS